MKKEISAGGIIVRRHRGIWQVLVIEDSYGQRTFPKGKIEAGETNRKAALREISEEVGLTGLRYVGSLPAVTYIYTRGQTVDKRVYFYIFRYEGSETPVGQAQEGIRNPIWMSLRQAIRCIGYPKSNRPLLESTMERLNKL